MGREVPDGHSRLCYDLTDGQGHFNRSYMVTDIQEHICSHCSVCNDARNLTSC